MGMHSASAGEAGHTSCRRVQGPGKEPRVHELPVAVFKHSIRARYRSDAFLIRREKVEVARGSNASWGMDVLVFVLVDFSPPTLCYAWSVGPSVTSLVHEPRVDSPKAAVRASLETSTAPNAIRRIG